MRDTKKTKEYFENYVSKRKKSVEVRREKYNTTLNNNEDITIVAHMYFRELINLIQGQFSLGESKEVLSETYNELLNVCYKYEIQVMDDVIKVLSLGVLLDINPLEQMKITLDEVMDPFLGLLAGHFGYELTEEQEDIQPEDPYDLLILSLNISFDEKDEIINELQEFLDLDWYQAVGPESYWYETLDNTNDVYFGYWCFEAMAIAKISNIDIDLFESDYVAKL